MNFLSKLFKKKQRHDAVCTNVDASSVPPGTVTLSAGSNMLPAAEVLNRSIAFGISYAASMQGVNLVQEEMNAIMEVINGAIHRTMGTPSTPSSTKNTTKKSSKKEEDDDCRFRRLFSKFEAYVKLRYVFRFNTITGCAEVAKYKENPAELVFGPATERIKGTIVQEVQCAGIDFWGCDVDRYLESESVPEYHPFTQYFEQLPEWDGQDRVTALAQRISGNEVWKKGFHRWMLAATAQWMGYARKKRGVCSVRANSVAPLLISEEQGWGKSIFCRMLLPEALQTYYTDSFDVAQPSSCEAKLMDYGLINLDEFDRIPDKRGSQLKNLMQMTALNIRKAYRKSAGACFRLASFIGTSNSRNLLADKSGSRRFLCVELEHPIDCDTPIEYEQLYAQLKHEILSGERYWFSKKEEKEIQENNSLYYKEVPVEELFCKTFSEVDKKVEGAEYLSADDIFMILKTTYPVEMAGVNLNLFNRELPTFAHRQHTNSGNRYCVLRKK
jgi:hypothetical protein